MSVPAWAVGVLIAAVLLSILGYWTYHAVEESLRQIRAATMSRLLVSKAAGRPIPAELDLLVQSCLEKRREDRPQRVTDLVEALEALCQEHRWTQADARQWWERSAAVRPA